MRHYAKIYPKFWITGTGKQIRELGTEAIVVALYLLTSPHANMIGVYYLPLSYIAHDTGLSMEKASKVLQSLCDICFCSYDNPNEYVWVHNMAFYQIAESSKISDHQIKSVNELFQNLPNLSFLNEFFMKYQDCLHLESKQKNQAPSKALLSQEQEQELEQKQKQKQKQKQEQDNIEIPNGISLSCKHDDVKFENYFFETKPSQVSSTQPQIQSTDRCEEAKAVLEFLNQKANRAFRMVDSNLDLIMERLKSGATVTQCRQVIVKKAREWGKDEKMQFFLRPKTLFSATNFEQYLGELVLPRQEENA